jgi:hypothetical protein
VVGQQFAWAGMDGARLRRSTQAAQARGEGCRGRGHALSRISVILPLLHAQHGGEAAAMLTACMHDKACMWASQCVSQALSPGCILGGPAPRAGRLAGWLAGRQAGCCVAQALSMGLGKQLNNARAPQSAVARHHYRK